MTETLTQLHSYTSGSAHCVSSFDCSHMPHDFGMKAEDIAEYISDLLVSLESLAVKTDLHQLAKLIMQARDEANVHIR